MDKAYEELPAGWMAEELGEVYEEPPADQIGGWRRIGRICLVAGRPGIVEEVYEKLPTGWMAKGREDCSESKWRVRRSCRAGWYVKKGGGSMVRILGNDSLAGRQKMVEETSVKLPAGWKVMECAELV